MKKSHVGGAIHVDGEIYGSNGNILSRSVKTQENTGNTSDNHSYLNQTSDSDISRNVNGNIAYENKKSNNTGNDLDSGFVSQHESEEVKIDTTEYRSSSSSDGIKTDLAPVTSNCMPQKAAESDSVPALSEQIDGFSQETYEVIDVKGTSKQSNSRITDNIQSSDELVSEFPNLSSLHDRGGTSEFNDLGQSNDVHTDDISGISIDVDINQSNEMEIEQSIISGKESSPERIVQDYNETSGVFSPDTAQSYSDVTGSSSIMTRPTEYKDDDDDDNTQEKVLVDYASKLAGAQILEKSPSLKGTSNLLTGDIDRYAIAPCEDKKYVVIGLSEDILVKSIGLSNYERYSSHVREFQVLASQDYPASSEYWVDLGVYTAKSKNGEQIFELKEPAWARYLKFKFLSHYGREHYCTYSQIKVHGSTMLQGFHEQWIENEKKDVESKREKIKDYETTEDLKHLDERNLINGEVKFDEENQRKEESSHLGIAQQIIEETNLNVKNLAIATNESDQLGFEERAMIDHISEHSSLDVAEIDDFTYDNKSLPSEPHDEVKLSRIEESQVLDNLTFNENNTDSHTTASDDAIHQSRDNYVLNGKDGIDAEDSPSAGFVEDLDAKDTDYFHNSNYNNGTVTQHEVKKHARSIHDGDGNRNKDTIQHDIKDIGKESDLLQTNAASSTNDSSIQLVTEVVKAAVADATDAVNEIKKMIRSTITGGDKGNNTTVPSSNDSYQIVCENRTNEMSAGVMEENQSQQVVSQYEHPSRSNDVQYGSSHEADSECSSTAVPPQSLMELEPKAVLNTDATVNGSKRQLNTSILKKESKSIEPEKKIAINALSSTDLLVVKLSNRFPSANCISDLDFQTLNTKPLHVSAGPGSSVGGLKMEPIFAKITQEIKSIQNTQNQYEHFISSMKECYEKVFLDIENDLERMQTNYDRRLAILEHELSTVNVKLNNASSKRRMMIPSFISNDLMSSFPRISDSGSMLMGSGIITILLFFLLLCNNRKKRQATTPTYFDLYPEVLKIGMKESAPAVPFNKCHAVLSEDSIRLSPLPTNPIVQSKSFDINSLPTEALPSESCQGIISSIPLEAISKPITVSSQHDLPTSTSKIRPGSSKKALWFRKPRKNGNQKMHVIDI